MSPRDLYMLIIDRRSHDISMPGPMVIPELDLRDAILSATGDHLAASAASARLTEGAVGIFEKVTIREWPKSELAYVGPASPSRRRRLHGRPNAPSSKDSRPCRAADPRALSHRTRKAATEVYRHGQADHQVHPLMLWPCGSAPASPTRASWPLRGRWRLRTRSSGPLT